MGIFIGYTGFYLIRNNVSLVASILKDHGIMSASDIGLVANAVLFAYGLSKFFMAMLSDRANARYFMPLGLALSAVMNLFIAFVPALTASVGLFAVLMFINGWFQGMGWPPSGRVLVHWFSTRERGWKTSIWNCAHNVGGAGVGLISAWALDAFASDDADWAPAFWAPAIVALGVAVVAFLLIRDRPEAMGLPPIEEFADDPAKVEADESKEDWRSLLFNHVLKSRVILLLAVTNVFVYTLRYGVLNWIPVYLTDSSMARTSRTASSASRSTRARHRGNAAVRLGVRPRLPRLALGRRHPVPRRGGRGPHHLLAAAADGAPGRVLPVHRDHRRDHLRAGHAHRPAGH